MVMRLEVPNEHLYKKHKKCRIPGIVEEDALGNTDLIEGVISLD